MTVNGGVNIHGSVTRAEYVEPGSKLDGIEAATRLRISPWGKLKSEKSLADTDELDLFVSIKARKCSKACYKKQ